MNVASEKLTTSIELSPCLALIKRRKELLLFPHLIRRW